METGLDLAISIGDIFGYINQLFAAYWPLLAFGLGLLALPKVISGIKSVFAGKRG